MTLRKVNVYNSGDVCSAGLRVFLAADKKMLDKGGELNMRNIPKSVMGVFEMTGFSDALTII